MADRRSVLGYDHAMQPPSMMTPKGGSGMMYDNESVENPQTTRRRLMPVAGDVTPQKTALEQVLALLQQRAGA